MDLIFCRNNTPSSLFISAMTLSAWSHVAVATKTYVIDSMHGHGVRKRSRASFLEGFPRHVVVPVDVLFEARALAWLTEQIGKPYDTTALWGLAAHRDWQREDAWFCSELASTALLEGGYFSAYVGLPAKGRVTPGELRAITRPFRPT